MSDVNEMTVAMVLFGKEGCSDQEPMRSEI
jgi:hypothetical protein